MVVKGGFLNEPFFIWTYKTDRKTDENTISYSHHTLLAMSHSTQSAIESGQYTLITTRLGGNVLGYGLRFTLRLSFFMQGSSVPLQAPPTPWSETNLFTSMQELSGAVRLCSPQRLDVIGRTDLHISNANLTRSFLLCFCLMPHGLSFSCPWICFVLLWMQT